MRRALVDALQQVAPGSKVDYLLKQRGMFSYTGFSAAQVDRLRDEFGVYLIASGRMCVAGLNSRNVQQVAKAFAAVMPLSSRLSLPVNGQGQPLGCDHPLFYDICAKKAFHPCRRRVRSDVDKHAHY